MDFLIKLIVGVLDSGNPIEAIESIIGIFDSIFSPFFRKSEKPKNLQKIETGLFEQGARNIKLLFKDYQRWGYRRYIVTFDNRAGVSCATEFMIPRYHLNAIEWTIPPKNIL